MRQMNAVDWIASILVIIGAINWGLVAFDFNLVDAIFGMGSVVAQIIYGLIGIAGLWMIYTILK